MTREEVLERLRNVMAEILEADPADIVEEARLLEDLDADSLDILDLTLALKDEFHVTIEDGEAKALITELAQFLPEEYVVSDEVTDEELAEIGRKLTVGTLVQFVLHKLAVSVE